MRNKLKSVAYLALALSMSSAWANVNIMASNEATKDYRFNEVGFLSAECYHSGGIEGDVNEQVLINLPDKGMVYLPTLNTDLRLQIKEFLEQDKNAGDIWQELVANEEERQKNNIWLNYAQIYTRSQHGSYALYMNSSNLRYQSGNLNILSDNEPDSKNKAHFWQQASGPIAGTLPVFYQGYHSTASDSLLFRFTKALNQIRRSPGKGGYACVKDSKNANQYMTVSIHINRYDMYNHVKNETNKYFFSGKTLEDDGISGVVEQIVQKATAVKFVEGKMSFPYFAMKNSVLDESPETGRIARDNLFLTQDVLLKDLRDYKFELKEWKRDHSDYPGTTIFNVTVTADTKLSDLNIPPNPDSKTCYSLFVTAADGKALPKCFYVLWFC